MTHLPRLVVTLTALSVETARAQIAEVAAAGADVAELRFDLWPDSERDRVEELFPSALPLLATLRSRAEGGEGPDAPAERAVRLHQFRLLPFERVDAELARDPTPAFPPEFARTLASRHLSETVTLAEISRMAEAPPSAGTVVKLVVPATVARFLRDILPNLPRWLAGGATVLTTGPSGPLARIWARELGEPMVFAAPPWGDGTPPPVEPAQVAVDQLRRSWAVDRGRCFAVVGNPVAHSLSPRVHATWLSAEARPAVFVSMELWDADELESMVRLGARGWWDGWSVTHPWKARVAELADERSPTVVRTGVANTISFRNGVVRADLTDGVAVARRAGELLGSGQWDGAEALVIGTGGAARAAVDALGSPRRTVWVAGRRSEAARALAAELGGIPAFGREAHPIGLVVQATTVGRGSGAPLEPAMDEWIGPPTTVLDFVYAADAPTLRQRWSALGARYEDGRRLLVYQAAAAHELWWGQAPAEAEVSSALRRVGCVA